MEPLIVLCVLFVIATPILAIVAFFRTERFQQQIKALPVQNLVSRIYALEQRLARLEEGAPTETDPAPSPTPVSSPVPPPFPQPPHVISAANIPAPPAE